MNESKKIDLITILMEYRMGYVKTEQAIEEIEQIFKISCKKENKECIE